MKVNDNEKIFYMLVDGDKKGPFSLNDLKKNKLTGDTVIWYYLLSGWKKLSEIEELNEELKYSIMPPEINSDNPLSELESNSVDVSNENWTLKSPQTNSSFIKHGIQYLIGWIAFHSFALLTSYGEVNGFNNIGSRSSEIIWPFSVRWFYCGHNGVPSFGAGTCESRGGIITFNGIFTEYDITDFLLYVGLSIFISIFVYTEKSKQQQLF